MSSFTPEQLAELNNLLDGRLTTNLSNVNTSGEILPNLRSAGASVVKEFWQQGTEWYRLWSDGWLEQGGITSSFGRTDGVAFNLLKPFASDSYSLLAMAIGISSVAYTTNCSEKQVASFKLSTSESASATRIWYACGMADTSN